MTAWAALTFGLFKMRATFASGDWAKTNPTVRRQTSIRLTSVFIHHLASDDGRHGLARKFPSVERSITTLRAGPADVELPFPLRVQDRQMSVASIKDTPTRDF